MTNKKIEYKLINKNRNILGNIYFNSAFILYIIDNNKDPRKGKNNKYINEDFEEFYLFSYFNFCYYHLHYYNYCYINHFYYY